MLTAYALNQEEIVFINNYRKLTNEQRDTISSILAGIALAHGPKVALVVDNVRELRNVPKEAVST